MSEDRAQSADGNTQCPVCGQEYDHFRREERHGERTELRSDAFECRQEVTKKVKHAEVHDGWKVYVHV